MQLSVKKILLEEIQEIPGVDNILSVLNSMMFEKTCSKKLQNFKARRMENIYSKMIINQERSMQIHSFFIQTSKIGP